MINMQVFENFSFPGIWKYPEDIWGDEMKDQRAKRNAITLYY